MRTLTLYRAALPITATLALLTGCTGDSGNDSAASASSSSSSAPAPETSSSAPETTTAETSSAAPQADSEFCTQAGALNSDLESVFAGQVDPNTLGATLQKAADGVRAIDPPPELSGDWQTFADGLEEFSSVATNLDPSDPKSVAEFQQRATQLQSQLGSASKNIDTYLSEQCGLDTGSSSSSAPTS